MFPHDLERLLAVARGPSGAWPAAAAAIDVLWWLDRFAEAGALAEEVITRFRHAPGKLFDHDFPWSEAVLIGAEAAGADPVQVTSRVSAMVPEESALGERLRWLLGELPDRPPHSLVSGFDFTVYVQRRLRRLTPAQEELAASDPASLSAEERRKLVSWAHSAGRPEIIVRIYDAGFGPRDWLHAFDLARYLIKADRVADATSVLLDNLDLWFSEHPWHVAPAGITTQPDMRRAVTPELREAVLSNVDISRVPGVGG